MKRRKHYHQIGLLAAGCLTLFSSMSAYAHPVAQAAPDVKLAGKEEPTRADVARAQQELTRVSELYKQGLAPAEDVVKAKMEVAEARIRLSTTQQQPRARVVPELETLVRLGEQLFALATARHKAGVLPSKDLNAARIALAEARIRLELNQLVGLREQESAAARAAFEAGMTTQQEVAKADHLLEKARQRLAANEAAQKPGQ